MKVLTYQFEFHPYQRSFKRPLSTHHGTWEVREGIILRLTDEMGRVGWGEIAPIPWFGSETLEQALEFCQQLPPKITATDIFSIPTKRPACQFGFESAWEWANTIQPLNTDAQIFQNQDLGIRPPSPPILGGSGFTPPKVEESGGQSDGICLSPENKILSVHPWHPCCADGVQGLRREFSKSSIPNSQSSIPFSYLLATGEAALESWQTPWNQGSRTFKWKIGVASLEEELKIFNQLIQALPPSAKLRLDANGGLTQQQAHQWLKAIDAVGSVEFLEQPLPSEQLDAMLEMSTRYSTPIALDESVATLDQLEDCYQKGWRGIFVIKAAIAGSPRRLRRFCQYHNIDAVFSSVFETAIARQAVLHLAAELSNPNRAVGFGVNQWFNKDEESVYSLVP